MRQQTQQTASKAENMIREQAPEMLAPVLRFAQRYPLLTGAITYAALSATLAFLFGAYGYRVSHSRWMH